jgi:release factor glutamine methyltransferase
MTVRELLREGTARLREAASSAPFLDTPYLDAVVLLGHAMAVEKEQLFAALLDTVDEETAATFRELLDRRAQGTPVSYIRQKKEFFGREFFVDERVLVPRPETEHVVEAVLALADSWGTAPIHIHDCCSGSGCIAISLAAERPALSISASEADPGALAVFRRNSRQLLGRELPLAESDLLTSVEGPVDIVVSNPPYVPSAEVEKLCRLGWPEPPSALDGGADGLEVIRRLAGEAVDCVSHYGYLVSEIGHDQAERVRDLLAEYGFRVVGVDQDLAGRDRVIVAQKTDDGTVDRSVR